MNHYTNLIILLFIFFINFGCARYSDEIESLQTRLANTEKALDQVNSSYANTMTLLEDGRCSLKEIEEESALLICGDGTSFRIKNGEDGNSCSVETTATGSKVSCTDGTIALITNGTNGVDGSSCEVNEVLGGSQVTCSDGSGAFIANGTNGSSCMVQQTESGAQIKS